MFENKVAVVDVRLTVDYRYIMLDDIADVCGCTVC